MWFEDVGPLGEHDLEGVGVALAVGDQHLDRHARRASADGADDGGELGGAAVGQVVAGDRGDDGEAQAHALDGLGHPLGLHRVGGQRVPGVHQAEAARPGAALAVDHEGGGAVGPALRQVRAARLLAHRDEVEVAHRLADRDDVVGEPQRCPHPLGLAAADVEALGDAGLARAGRPASVCRRPLAGAERHRRRPVAADPGPSPRLNGDRSSGVWRHTTSARS